MGNVSVTLLGGFAASVDGVQVAESAWRLKKARELVKLLALAHGHRLHREQAIDVLWRDRGLDAAANNLNQAVYVARRALDAGAITVRDGMLELSADVDVALLEVAAAEARHRAPRVRIARRSGCMAASCCLRTVMTIGPRSEEPSWLIWPQNSPMAPRGICRHRPPAPTTR